MTMIHTAYSISGTNAIMMQSIAVNHCSNLNIQKSIRVTTKMSTRDYFEFTMRTDLSKSFSEEETDIYFHDGTNNVLKQYYTLEQAAEFNLTKKNDTIAYIGLNGFASIYGTSFKDKENNFFGFVNSNSILVNPLARNNYEIMLMRNTNYYDDKGITNPLIDNEIETFDQILFFTSGVKEFEHVQKVLSSTINDKLQVRQTTHIYSKDTNTKDIALIHDFGISGGFADIDVVDVILKDSKLTFVIFKFRSRWQDSLETEKFNAF